MQLTWNCIANDGRKANRSWTKTRLWQKISDSKLIGALITSQHKMKDELSDLSKSQGNVTNTFHVRALCDLADAIVDKWRDGVSTMVKLSTFAKSYRARTCYESVTFSWDFERSLSSSFILCWDVIRAPIICLSEIFYDNRVFFQLPFAFPPSLAIQLQVNCIADENFVRHVKNT